MLERVWRERNPPTLLVGMYIGTSTRFITTINIEVPCDPAIPLLGVDTEKTKISRDTCTPTIMAAPCTIGKIRKQPKWRRTDECMKKMVYIHTMEYSSAIKKDEIMPFPATGKEVEMIILNEVSETGKDKYHMISLLGGT